MNNLQVFNYNDNQIRTIMKGNEPWWVLKDVCEALSLSNPTIVADRLDDDERAKFNLGRQGETNIINEAGLYSVILRSDKPEAKQFKRWVTHEVLPSIRKTGGYSMTDHQRMMADTRNQNIRIRKAQILERLAKQYDGTYRQVLHAYATKELTGDYLLPLPKAPAPKTYTATEIGERFGISAAKVGALTNRHNLKTEEYGAWFVDKSPYSTKEVTSFRYFDNIVPVLGGLLGK